MKKNKLPDELDKKIMEVQTIIAKELYKDWVPTFYDASGPTQEQLKEQIKNAFEKIETEFKQQPRLRTML